MAAPPHSQQFRAFSVEVAGEKVQILSHRPGHPRMYRVDARGNLRRIKEDDPIIALLPEAMKQKVRETKALAANRLAEAARRKTLRYRIARAIGVFLGSIAQRIRRALAWRPWSH